MAKKKINDDTLLQLIRDGNSSAGAARFFVGGKLRKCAAREDKTRHQLQPSCQCTSFRIFQHIICIPGVGSREQRIAPLCSSFLCVPDRRPGDPICWRKLAPPALPRLRVRISRLRDSKSTVAPQTSHWIVWGCRSRGKLSPLRLRMSASILLEIRWK